MNTITEKFYVATYNLDGSNFSGGRNLHLTHFGQSREDAVTYAARTSRYPAIAEVQSTVEPEPIETWVAGSYFRVSADGWDHAKELEYNIACKVARRNLPELRKALANEKHEWAKNLYREEIAQIEKLASA